MKKFITTITALMLTVFLAFAFNGCKPVPDDPDGPENNMPTEEGVYLGIIGFNQTLTVKDISLLNNSTYSSFKNFISDMEMQKGTGLYYADYNAIEKLKSYGEPPKLANVALVTFTDGLDNVSLTDEINVGNYNSTDQYCTALNNKIKNDMVYGKAISAYTIGIKGNDVYDDVEFYNNLNKLASSQENVFEASDMDEALQYFAEIAESLNSTTTTTTLKLQIPGGYNEGTVIRFTFDNVGSADNSKSYIECTYRRTSSGRTLENITYHGLKNGETVLNSVAQSGLYYEFAFNNLTFENGNVVTSTDVKKIKLWKKISSGWQPDGEFTPENSSEVVEEKSSALIMLVLDCTSSLGNQFNNMKQGAIKFVETLLSSGGNSGGLVGNQDETFTVKGVSFTMRAVEGGTFQMGATSEQGSDADSDEKPVHSVTLSDYHIGETEVTQELWTAVMGSNPSYYKGNNKPVETVSWNDCQEFITKLNQLTGKNFRLPTEAEWEYAARGGKKSKGYKYSGSNTIGDVAWYDGNSSSKTHDVKTKQANELGIYDMSGNVWEWCQDWYGSYSSSSQTNPTGPSSGSYRVYRGGSWDYDARYCRVSLRNGGTPGYDGSGNLGLRLCLSQY